MKDGGEKSTVTKNDEVLQKLSADERKRLEYEARQKAILDYNSQMSSSREEGIRTAAASAAFFEHVQFVKSGNKTF